MIEWQFEHFKTFTPYEIMQQAAASLALYEGESTNGINPKMQRLTSSLKEQTGHPAWMPERDNGNLKINTEGSVFRNKARLFSSFYICVPPDLLKETGEDKVVMLTGFGKALADGRVSEKEFYDFIIRKFAYPHRSFSDYAEWVELGVVIRPFVAILSTLVELFKNEGKEAAYLTAYEVYKFIQPCTDKNYKKVAETIASTRKQDVEIEKLDIRKINEMFAFLSIAGYVYIDSSVSKEDRYYLNLIARHPQEKTLFYLSRTAGGAGTGQKKERVNLIENIEKLLKEDEND